MKFVDDDDDDDDDLILIRYAVVIVIWILASLFLEHSVLVIEQLLPRGSEVRRECPVT